jgi:hypothetical protein
MLSYVDSLFGITPEKLRGFFVGWDEKSCLKQVSATLIRVAQRWVRVRMIEPQWARLEQLRRELGQTPPPSGERQHLRTAA